MILLLFILPLLCHFLLLSTLICFFELSFDKLFNHFSQFCLLYSTCDPVICLSEIQCFRKIQSLSSQCRDAPPPSSHSCHCTVPSSEQIPDFKRIACKLIDPRQAKDWHTSVPMELRNHLGQKIVQALISNPDPSTLRDNRMVTLIEYVRNTEGNMFQEADSRDEYYQLVAEEIYKIQKK